MPVGAVGEDRQDHHKYSWAGLLGKMHSFPIPGEDMLASCFF